MSDHSMNDVLPCEKCQEVWKCPRAVEFQPETLPGHLADVDPYTTETIVVYETFKSRGPKAKPTFSTQFFENIRFTYNAPRCCGGSNYRLVKSFEYTDDEIFYTTGDSDERDDTKYFAQLVTLNSWYQDLSGCLLFAILLAMDHVSSFSFCLWAIDVRRLEDKVDTLIPGIVLFAYCILRLLIELRVAAKAAEWLWFAKANASSGDLISNLGPTDMRIAKISTMLMTFLEVPGNVRDVVINLHPWKAVQPYAAFKCEGHRATVIGYKNRIDFEVANNGGLHNVQHCRLITKLVFIVGQLAALAAVEDSHLTRFVVASIMLLESVVIACIYAYRSYRTQRARNACHRNLVKFFYNTAGMHDAQIKVQRRVAERNLASWFHQQIHEDKEHLLQFTTLDIRHYQEDFEENFNGCLGCGRPKDFTHQTTSRPIRRSSTRSTGKSTMHLGKPKPQELPPPVERPPLPPHLRKERQADFDSTFALPREVKFQKDLDEELQNFSMEEGIGSQTTQKEGASGASGTDTPPSRQGLSHQQLQVPRKDSLEYSRKLNRAEASGTDSAGIESIQEEAADAGEGPTSAAAPDLPDAI